jgi:2-deoxy-D-gluconate 3-dehydrogenase
MMSKDFTALTSLEGRVAWVTGGGQGIGRAICERLSSAGASILITDINQHEADSTAAAINSRGGRAIAVVSDAADPDQAIKMSALAADRYGRLDILVNNAGIYPPGRFLEIDPEQWRRTIDLSLKATFFNSQAATKQMISAGHGGRIINLASTNALRPIDGLSAYGAAKGGVIALSRSLAKELGPMGVTVNTIAPGPIVTPGARAVRAKVRQSVQDYPDTDVPRGVLDRIGRPDDIANAVYFLASDLAAHITGILLVVDAGFLLT